MKTKYPTIEKVLSAYPTWTVKVSLAEIIDSDAEGFLDLLSELAVGSPLLMDIRYKVVAIGDEPNTLMIEVSGDDSQVVNEN